MKQRFLRSTLILLVLSILFSMGLSSKHVSAQLQDPIVSVNPVDPQAGQLAIIEANIEIALC